MIIQRDEIQSFIPPNPKFIILGTMCAINARTINDEKPNNEYFYYNDNRNHFWKILQYIFEPNNDPRRLSIDEKKNFLKKHKIGIQNLVYEIQVPNNSKLDPSDTVLFECYKKNKIKFKSLSTKTIRTINKMPLFFTCRYKKGIHLLLEGFIEQNKLKKELIEKTWYLKSPTRCNPYQRSLEWAKEMSTFVKI